MAAINPVCALQLPHMDVHANHSVVKVAVNTLSAAVVQCSVLWKGWC